LLPKIPPFKTKKKRFPSICLQKFQQQNITPTHSRYSLFFMKKFLVKDTLPSVLPQVNRSDITLIERKKHLPKRKVVIVQKIQFFRK